MVGGGLLILENFTLAHLAVHDPVIRRLHPARHGALHVRRSLLQDGRAAARGGPLHPFEAVRSGGEPNQKVLHQRLEALLGEAVQDELVPNLHEGLDRAVLGDGDGETQWLEGRLRDPRRDHRRLGGSLRRRDDVQPAGDAAERLRDVGGHGVLHRLERLLLGEHLSEVGAGLLEELVRSLGGVLLHLERGDHLLHAHARELAREGTDGFVVSAVRLRD